MSGLPVDYPRHETPWCWNSSLHPSPASLRVASQLLCAVPVAFDWIAARSPHESDMDLEKLEPIRPTLLSLGAATALPKLNAPYGVSADLLTVSLMTCILASRSFDSVDGRCRWGLEPKCPSHNLSSATSHIGCGAAICIPCIPAFEFSRLP
jgi:hypothetical protein